MASIPDEIINVLTTVPAANALLTGGAYQRPLDREGTPGAFAGVYYRVAAYVVDGDEYEHFRSDYIPTAYYSVPEIRMLAPAHDQGKQALRDLVYQIKLLFYDYVMVSDYGPRLFFRWAETTRIIDSEEHIGACTCTVRLQVTGVISSNL